MAENCIYIDHADSIIHKCGSSLSYTTLRIKTVTSHDVLNVR